MAPLFFYSFAINIYYNKKIKIVKYFSLAEHSELKKYSFNNKKLNKTNDPYIKTTRHI